MTVQRLQIGVIGCGMVSGYGHLPAIAASSDWHLAAVSDRDSARLESARREYGAGRAFADYRALLQTPGLDAVVVATHVDSHAEIVTEALSRGLHVLCEKPMAATVEQCRAMVAASERAGRILAINFNARSAPIYREIKRLIDSNAVGALRVVRFAYLWSCHQWKPPERMEAFMAGGGPILDSGVHFFDAARWFTGAEFESVQAVGVSLPPHAAPQHVIATGRLAGNAIALVEVGWFYCRRTRDEGMVFTMDVIGEDGAISYDATTASLRVYTSVRTEHLHRKDTGKHFEVVYDLFARSIRSGAAVDGLATGLDGLRATEAALIALESARASPPAAAR